MKKTLSLVSGLLLGASSFAADLQQLTLAIETQGPDYYADGQPLQIGETYLLVYINKGAAFQGLFTDGTLVDPVKNKIATKGVAVAGSKCDYKPIQYPADLYPAGGAWVIVALDTRTAAGAVGGLVAGLGVSSTAATGAATSLGTMSVAATTGDGTPSVKTTTPSQVSAAALTPEPVITAVEPDSETVRVRFKNINSAAIYEVQSTTDLASGNWESPKGAKGRISARDPMNVGAAELSGSAGVSPATDKVRFFRVITPPAMNP